MLFTSLSTHILSLRFVGEGWMREVVSGKCLKVNGDWSFFPW